MMFKLQALDTLTFRTANPFDAGINFHAYSLFPPLPSVYAGALRQGNEIKARKIKIGFSGVMIADEFSFPQPLDTVITKGKAHTDDPNKNVVTTMKLINAKTSNHELDKMITPREELQAKVNNSDDLYLTKKHLLTYLEGKIHNEYENLNDYYTRESHIGIEMEKDSHTTKKGLWYSTELIRPFNCSLVVEAEGTGTSVGDVVKLGGNTKLAKVDDVEPFTLPVPTSQSKYFKLYFATPAVFKYGWLPRWIDPRTKIGEFSFRRRKIKVKLVAAAIGKPVPVGGYSTNGPRPMRMAIPAGSVYYFELLGDSIFEDAVKLFNQKCISDYRESCEFDYNWWTRLVYCDRGFGYTFIGKYEEGN